MKKINLLTMAFLFLVSFSQSGNAHVYSSYEGYDLCSKMVGFAESRSYYVSGPQCRIVLNLNKSHKDWTGSEYGSFSLTLYNGNRQHARYNGGYKVQVSNWNIYLNMRSTSFPSSGVNYPFGTVYSNAINLATSFRSSTQVRPVHLAIDPVYPN